MVGNSSSGAACSDGAGDAAPSDGGRRRGGAGGRGAAAAWRRAAVRAQRHRRATQGVRRRAGLCRGRPCAGLARRRWRSPPATNAHRSGRRASSAASRIARGSRRRPWRCAVTSRCSASTPNRTAFSTTTFAEQVASRKERQRASDELGADAALIIFSAKESIYKAWYPTTARWLDFDAVTVSVDRSGVFSIEPRADLAGDDRALLSGLHGRFAVTPAHVLTAVYG